MNLKFKKTDTFRIQTIADERLGRDDLPQYEIKGSCVSFVPTEAYLASIEIPDWKAPVVFAVHKWEGARGHEWRTAMFDIGLNIGATGKTREDAVRKGVENLLKAGERKTQKLLKAELQAIRAAGAVPNSEWTPEELS